MNEDEHSDGEFCYPDELESHKENSEEEIENFVKEQKSENTTRKSFSDIKTFQRYLSSVSKGNVEVFRGPEGASGVNSRAVFAVANISSISGSQFQIFNGPMNFVHKRRRFHVIKSDEED